MHDFLNNGKRLASSNSTASLLISKKSSGFKDSSKLIRLTTKESIANTSSQSVDVTGINMYDDETNSGSISSDGYDSYNLPEVIFHHQHNGQHWVHKMYRKFKTPLNSGTLKK